MKYITIFYAGMVHSELDRNIPGFSLDLPDDAYIYFNRTSKLGFKNVHDRVGWFRKDLTPVLDQDVPKELLVWQLIL